jgi:2,5-furandicarboxylate decarboxylase 1
MGLDATKPLESAEHVFTRVRIPGEHEVDLATALRTDAVDLDQILAG